MFTLKTCYKTSSSFLYALFILNVVYTLINLFVGYVVYSNIDANVASSTLFGYLHLSQLSIYTLMSFCVHVILLASLAASKLYTKKYLRVSILINIITLLALVFTNVISRFCESIEKSMSNILAVALTDLCLACVVYCIICCLRNKEC